MSLGVQARTVSALRRIVSAHWLLAVIVMLLLAAGMRPAAAQVIDSKAFPYGEIRFSAPENFCVDSLSVTGEDIGRVRAVSSYLVPTMTAHLGMPVDIYAGFRLRSQPGRLWLIYYRQVRPELIEYNGSASPITYFAQPGTLSHLTTIGLFSAINPTDLSHLVDDGEALVGYGLRQGEASTPADSFKEMMDSGRFHLVWRVGQPSETQTCFAYDSIQVVPFFASGIN